MQDFKRHILSFSFHISSSMSLKIVSYKKNISHITKGQNSVTYYLNNPQNFLEGKR